MKLNTIYHTQDIGVPNDDGIWLKKSMNSSKYKGIICFIIKLTLNVSVLQPT